MLWESCTSLLETCQALLPRPEEPSPLRLGLSQGTQLAIHSRAFRSRAVSFPKDVRETSLVSAPLAKGILNNLLQPWAQHPLSDSNRTPFQAPE